MARLMLEKTTQTIAKLMFTDAYCCSIQTKY